MRQLPDRLAELALKIADQASASLIDTSTLTVLVIGTGPDDAGVEYEYQDLDSLDVDAGHWLDGAVEYLELRGLLRRWPTNPQLVWIEVQP